MCLQGILYVLYNDIAWQLLPAELGFGSGQTCWRCLDRWQQVCPEPVGLINTNRPPALGSFTKEPEAHVPDQRPGPLGSCCVILSMVYAVTRRLLSLSTLLLRRDVSKMRSCWYCGTRTRSCVDRYRACATNQPTACGSLRSHT